MSGDNLESLSLKTKLMPAVMSGGSGTRLWPLSTDLKPKQFHALAGDRSLIQESVARLRGSMVLDVADPILISNGGHAGILSDQMAAVGCSPAAVILEPFGRNTAAVGAVAALVAQALDPESLVLLMPADHVIADAEGFTATIAAAASAAQEFIVTFGVEPTSPETGYGYIESGDIIEGAVRRVARFAEKPDLKTAEAYLANGRHLWNAGIFLFSPKVLLAEMERLAPAVVKATRAALDAGRRDGVSIHLDETAFAACPSISIDYAVMEHTERAAVASIGVSWADVGSWSELWRLGPRVGANNFVHGDALLLDTCDCLVWSEGKTVGVIGVSDLIIVQTEDAVIVLPKSRAQDVKLLVGQVKARASAGKP
jgi:mannose-1-phosphate guanylyltransferase/mannose-6-phosphate isomerase